MKNKRKRTATNPIRYWLDEFLFARHFEYETDLSVEEIWLRMVSLTHPKPSGSWQLETISHTTLHPDNTGLDFHVQHKRQKSRDYFGFVTSYARGIAVVDNGTGQTIVRGIARFGTVLHIVLFIALFGLPSIALRPADDGVIRPLIGFVYLLIIVLGLWKNLYDDRNQLVAKIEQALTEKEKHDFSRLEASDDSPNESDYQHEQEQYQGAIHE